MFLSTSTFQDVASPLRLDQSDKGTDYSVAAAFIGSPIAQSNLNRGKLLTIFHCDLHPKLIYYQRPQ